MLHGDFESVIASEKPEIAAPKNPPVPEPKVSTTDTTPPSTPVAKIPGTKASPKSSTPLPLPRKKKCEAGVAKCNEEKELDPEEVKRYDLWWSKYKVKKDHQVPCPNCGFKSALCGFVWVASARC